MPNSKDFEKVLKSIEAEITEELKGDIENLFKKELAHMDFVSAFSSKQMEPMEKILKAFTLSLTKYQWRAFLKILSKLHEKGFFVK